MNVIYKSYKLLSDKYIKWISVIDRLSEYKIYNPDWPTLLGSLDATVQPISRSRVEEVQKAYYSGKHKMHCVKTQALVSPTGLLIYTSRPVEGSIHDFRLYKESDLEDLIFKGNEKCQIILGNNAVTLADSRYQGLSVRIPGAITPYKRKRYIGLTNE